MTTQTKLMTAEEFYQSQAGRERSELVRGEVIEMVPPNRVHGRTALRIGSALLAFVDKQDLGEVMVESGYIVERGPDTVRGPDVSFMSKQRLPPDESGTLIDGAPDLVVEVVSPSDSAGQVEEKTNQYFRAGARQVWWVYPITRSVIVHNPDGSARRYGESDTIQGGDVLPGLSLPVNRFFE